MRSPATVRSAKHARSRVAASGWLPAVVVALAGVSALMATAGAYGLHRDELYFVVAGQHPDWGYVDQPPLTPLLNAASAAVLGVSGAGIRALPALAYAVIVLLTAGIAGELGGTRRARGLAALTIAVSGLLAAGHLNTTATYDILGWTVVLLVVVRQLRGAPPWGWLVAGLAAGIALENKDLLPFLGLGLAVGVAVCRRWEVLRSPWVWAGIAVALALWMPNLAWQAAHGWPQLEMARVIGARSGSHNRVLLLPMQLLVAGPLLFPVAVAGEWWLLRAKAASAWRPVGVAYLVVLALLFVTGGKGYYAGGLLPTLVAAGGGVVDGWLGRGHVRLRAAGFSSAAVASAACSALLLLPIIPASVVATTPVAALNSDVGSQIGWDRVAATVRGVIDGLSPADRNRAVILAGNYGEAAALELLGGDGLPPVYSGHNSYADWGPPPEDRTLTVFVDAWDEDVDWAAPWLGPCSRAAVVDVGMTKSTSEEQGAKVWVCPRRPMPWDEAWPHLRHVS